MIPPQNDDDEILAKMKADHLEKSLRMRNIAKKSFILNDQTNESGRIRKEMDSELEQYMAQVKKLENEKRELNQASFFSPQFWKINVSRNPDLFTTLFLDCNLLLAIYPLNTIKTRIQAQHKFEDVTYFVKNRVGEKPTYKGISQAYISNVVGIGTTFTVAKIAMLNLEKNKDTKNLHDFTKSILALTAGEMAASPLRLAFEVRKQTLQICGHSLGVSEYLTKIRKSFFPSLMRDVLFRFNTGLFFNLILYHQYFIFRFSQLMQGPTSSKEPFRSKISPHDQFTAMILSTLISSAISNPFDVINTKLVTQQYAKYNGFIDTFRTVLREEGYKKLCFSGYWPRSAYHCLQSVVVFNLYGTVKQLFEKAFIDI